MKMRSKKAYINLDEYDSRVALFSEESFQYGINFEAKFIGSMEVPRPNSRVEIVAAMRRIRYDFKSKSVKKRKVTLTVSIEGVRISLKEKGKVPSGLTLMHYPIYRIFYVSHDSLDMNIFSFISREEQTFKCCVFKTDKKEQAMKVVRAIGQAFEVCHKLTLSYSNMNSPRSDMSLPPSTPNTPKTPEDAMTKQNKCTTHSILQRGGSIPQVITSLPPKEDTCVCPDTIEPPGNEMKILPPSSASSPPPTPSSLHPPSPAPFTQQGSSVSENNVSRGSERVMNEDACVKFSEVLKVIEGKIEQLNTKIERMEENQTKLFTLLNETTSSIHEMSHKSGPETSNRKESTASHAKIPSLETSATTSSTSQSVTCSTTTTASTMVPSSSSPSVASSAKSSISTSLTFPTLFPTTVQSIHPLSPFSSPFSQSTTSQFEEDTSSILFPSNGLSSLLLPFMGTNTTPSSGGQTNNRFSFDTEDSQNLQNLHRTEMVKRQIDLFSLHPLPSSTPSSGFSPNQGRPGDNNLHSLLFGPPPSFIGNHRTLESPGRDSLFSSGLSSEISSPPSMSSFNILSPPSRMAPVGPLPLGSSIAGPPSSSVTSSMSMPLFTSVNLFHQDGNKGPSTTTSNRIGDLFHS